MPLCLYLHGRVRARATLYLSCACDVCEKGVILPDNVAGLGEAARHKEAFDDVDFLIHGLRQVGGKLRFRDERRGETECKKETEVTSKHKLRHSTLKREEKDAQTGWIK